MKFITLIFGLIIIVSCSSVKGEGDIEQKFIVREYKIINDSVTSFNSRFARLSKEEDYFVWTKLIRLDSYSTLGYVDSFKIFDSLVIQYSLDENMEIDKIHNWSNLKKWSQHMIDEMLLHYDKPIPDDVNKLLEMGTDSTMFVSKNISEVNAYNYFNLTENKNTKEFFEKSEDDNGYYYKINLKVDEKDYDKANVLIGGILIKGFEIEGGKNTVEIIVDKNSGDFLMGIVSREMKPSNTKVVNQIIINKINDFNVGEIIKYDN